MSRGVSREYANQLRDAIALSRGLVNDDHESIYILAEAIGIPVGGRELLHAMAFIIGRMALDLAEDFPSQFPGVDDVWRDLLERIDRIEVDS
jgi:hypothetical protein